MPLLPHTISPLLVAMPAHLPGAGGSLRGVRHFLPCIPAPPFGCRAGRPAGHASPLVTGRAAPPNTCARPTLGLSRADRASPEVRQSRQHRRGRVPQADPFVVAPFHARIVAHASVARTLALAGAANQNAR